MSDAQVFTDSYVQQFKSQQQAEFRDFIKSRDKTALWLQETAKDLTFIPLEEGSEIAEEIQALYAAEGKADVIADTMQHTQLLLKTPDNLYLVRDCALKSIHGQARISGNALNDVPRSVYADILNRCMGVAKGKVLLRLADDKVSAVHGGDRSDYAVLEMRELVDHTVAYLDANFPGYEFTGGVFEHAMVSANWSLNDQEEMLDAYKEALDQHGLPSDHLSAVIRLTSSDVGISGARISFSLITGSQHYIALGNPLQVNHKHGAKMADFDHALSQLCGHYQLAIGKLTNLLDVEIHYPVNTLTGVMKYLKLPKKYSFLAIDGFKVKHGEDPCTAHDLYTDCIAEVSFHMAADGYQGTALINADEKITRALSVKWQDFDMPGNVTW